MCVLAIVCAVPCRGEEPSGRIGGLVLDPDGAAVAGASVVVEAPAGTVATTVTDASGRFDIASVPAGSYLLRVSYPGLQAEPRQVQADGAEQQELTIQTRLSALTDAVVVSASQVEAPLSSTPASVTVFSERDIELRQFDSSAQLLRLVPGMTVVQYGGRGTLTSLFPRGGESDYTLLLVDGTRVNSMGGFFDFSALPVADIERIEIVRGPQSAVYGADAIGGVVQVITRSGGPTRFSGLVEGGTLAYGRGAANAAGTLGVFGWGVSGEHAASDGFTGRAPGTGEIVTNDDSRESLGTVHVRFAKEAWTAAGQARLVKTERGVPGPYGSDPNDTFDGVNRVARSWNDHKTAAAQSVVTFSPRVRARGSISWADLDGQYRNAFGPSFSDTRRVDGRGQIDVALHEAVSFTAGAEYLREQGRSTYITAGTPDPLPIRRGVGGIFGEVRFDAARRLTGSAGVRVEHISRDPLEGDPNASRPPFDGESEVSVNPRAALSWFVREATSGPWSWTRLRVNAGTGIRPPDALELAYTDNPGLQPEESRSFDLGVEQAFFDGRGLLEAIWFYNRYDDLIVAVGTSFQDASRYRTDNIANARSRGLELVMTWRPLSWLDVRTGYTYLDTEILAVDGTSGGVPSPFAPGDALVRRPDHQGWIDATVTHRRVTGFARFGARGRVLDIDPSFGAFGGKVEAPGYAVTDLGASFSLWRTIDVFGRVTNVFDRAYEEAFGFPSPGRCFTGGVRVAASR